MDSPDKAALLPTDDILMRELGRLYRYEHDESRQFTRWQMIAAMAHGYRIARAEQPDSEVGK